jgi:hypothetical protein
MLPHDLPCKHILQPSATFTASSPSLLGTAAKKGKVGVARMRFFALSLSVSFVCPEAERQLRLEPLLALPASRSRQLNRFIHSESVMAQPPECRIYIRRRRNTTSFAPFAAAPKSLSAAMYLLKSCSVKK